MSVMGFQNKSLDGGGGDGGVSSIKVYFGLLEFVYNFSKPLSTADEIAWDMPDV